MDARTIETSPTGWGLPTDSVRQPSGSRIGFTALSRDVDRPATIGLTTLEATERLASVTVPGLRTVLGLHVLDGTAFGFIAAALAVSVVGAYVSARLTGETN